jgi:hypothetical protein
MKCIELLSPLFLVFSWFDAYNEAIHLSSVKLSAVGEVTTLKTFLQITSVSGIGLLSVKLSAAAAKSKNLVKNTLN